MILDTKYRDLLLEMLAIPATSRNEKARADHLETWIKREGFKVKRLANNLVITTGSRISDATLLLNSHIDTVSSGDGWITDPCQPTLENGKIIGLGSNDAGASAVALLASFSILSETNEGSNTLLVLSAEEEISGANGISMVLPELKSLRFAIVGEPTRMQPAVAERGLMVIDALIRGKQGHAAHSEGENAIYMALRDIERIREIKFTEKSLWLKDPSATVTQINAGTRHNVVPGKCEFVIDVRTTDRYSNERLLDILRSLCKAELVPRSMRLKSSALDPTHPAFGVLTRLGLKPFGSSTLSDMALIPFPSLKIGPGDSARSHTANEFVYESEIAGGINTYTDLVRELLKIEL